MTKERLQKLSTDSLHKIALNEGIKHTEDSERDDLIEQILEAMEEDRIERECSNNFAIRIQEKKYNICQDEELEAQEKTEYCIPDKYQETRITLLLRDPYWAYAFWDIRDTDLESYKEKSFKGLSLRVHKEERDGGSTGEDSENSFEIPIKESDNNWYINLPECGKRYRLDLIVKSGHTEEVMASSNSIESPLYTIADTIQKGSLEDSSGSMLAFVGIMEPEGTDGSQSIPQRIIQFFDTTNNFNFKQ